MVELPDIPDKHVWFYEISTISTGHDSRHDKQNDFTEIVPITLSNNWQSAFGK